MRYGAVFALGLAFIGSASSEVIEKLLDRAVKDVNDDVRRASMIAIGLVLINQPSETVKLVQLVKDSYNPNVRYGASMALAIACANSGNKEALEILDQASRKDSVDFVRQGSLIAAAFVAINHSESSSPKSKVGRLEIEAESTGQDRLDEIAITLLTLLERKLQAIETSYMAAVAS